MTVLKKQEIHRNGGVGILLVLYLAGSNPAKSKKCKEPSWSLVIQFWVTGHSYESVGMYGTPTLHSFLRRRMAQDDKEEAKLRRQGERCSRAKRTRQGMERREVMYGLSCVLCIGRRVPVRRGESV